MHGSEVVSSWLAKFRDDRSRGRKQSSRDHYGAMLCRFFKWLRVEKGWDVTPEELLNDQLRRLKSDDIKDRRHHVNLALEFTRDNRDAHFSALSEKRKYHYFSTIRSFYNYHEVPLTRALNKFGKKRNRKYYPKQITVHQFKKILGVLSQRERTIALIMFQSGMELGAVLYKFSYMWHAVKPQLEIGRERIKIEIDERKGNGNWYFTYISKDAVHELKKWLILRKEIVERVKNRSGYINPEIETGTPIFITNHGTRYRECNFHANYVDIMRRKGMKTDPYEKVSHMFRKLFKTEASIPARAIDRYIIEFWLGHTGGVEKVGAEYDRTPEIYEKVIEKEYIKLEPFINIYSSPIVRRQTDPLLRDLEHLAQNPFVRSVFENLVKEAKSKLTSAREKW